MIIFLKKLLDFLLIILILIYILFEEIVWEKIAKPIVKSISELILKFDIFENLIKKLENLSSYTVLFTFLILFTFVEILGVYAAIIFFQGKIFLAIFVYILKLPLAVVILWFFNITKDKLLKFKWFEFLYNNLISSIAKIKRFRIYILVKNKIDNIKEYVELKFNSTGNSIKSKILDIYQKLK